MKALLTTLLLTSLMFGQARLDPIPDRGPKPDYSTKYALVWRAAEETSYYAGNDAVGTKMAWVNHVDTYNSLDEVLTELNRTVYVKEADGQYEREVIGVYKFKIALSPDALKFSEGDEVTSEVVKRKEHWQKWEIAKPKAKP